MDRPSRQKVIFEMLPGLEPIPPAITSPSTSTIGLIPPRPVQSLRRPQQISQQAVQFQLRPQVSYAYVQPPAIQQAVQFQLNPPTVPIGIPPDPIEIRQPTRLISGMGEIEDLDEDLTTELDDFVYFYPDITDPDFQGKIGRKLEFAELAGMGQEPIPKRNEFFEHQSFVHRFLRVYDNVLLVHPPGSGKSCSVGGSSEEFRRSFITGAVDYTSQYLERGRNQIRHVYILVPGAVIKSEWEKQIICTCSREGDYDLSYLEEAGPTAVTRRVNKLLAPFYTIETYSKFVKNIMDKHMTDQDIIDEFSGSMFIIDEAHKLVPTKSEFGESEGSVRRALKGEIPSELTGGNGKRKKKEGILKKRLIYDTIMKVFHKVKRSKRILMTATPMINSTHEISDLINLIIPEGQAKMNPDVDYQDAPISELKKYFGGRVSFVPDMDTRVDAVYQGNPVKHQEIIGNRRYVFKTVVEESKMITSWSYINQQLAIERQATGKPDLSIMDWVRIGGIGRGNPDFEIREWVNQNGTLKELWQDDGYQQVSQTNIKFKSDRRQASNFVFPDGSFGEAGFNRFVTSSGDVHAPNDKLRQWLAPRLLKYRSAKYARGIALIKSTGLGKVIPIDEVKQPGLKWEDRPKGKVFCFSAQKRGSGIIVYGLAL